MHQMKLGHKREPTQGAQELKDNFKKAVKNVVNVI
jgi:hypothetical protein